MGDQETCLNCRGTGRRRERPGLIGFIPCSTCRGRGWLHGRPTDGPADQACDHCNGKGRWTSTYDGTRIECGLCSGSGRIPTTRGGTPNDVPPNPEGGL